MNQIVSVCHDLRIIPLERVTKFARVGSLVYAEIAEGNYDSGAIPGSISFASTPDDGLHKIKITFERAGVGRDVINGLNNLASLYLIAVYADETGRARVAGSPDWPLSLSYVAGEGGCSVTLEGSDVMPLSYMN